MLCLDPLSEMQTSNFKDENDLAIKIDPTNSDYYHNRGVIKHDMEDFLGAIDDYTKSIELETEKDGLTYYNRANSKKALQDFLGACSDARKAVQFGYDATELVNENCNQ